MRRALQWDKADECVFQLVYTSLQDTNGTPEDCKGVVPRI